MEYFLLFLGFILLIKGADVLVEGSSSVAKRYRVPNIVIGLTIVAFGTSMPELVVNVVASLNKSTEIAIGNILGSNIANILLILGVSSIIYPLKIHKNTIWKEIPFSLMAAVILAIMASDRLVDRLDYSALTRSDGLAFLGFFAIFIYYTFSLAKGESSSEEYKEESIPKSIIYILLGIVALVVGGKWIVDGAISISTDLGVSQSMIGLTVIAIGTSLPELATSAVAAYRKHTDIAVGNVVGSNIFNIFWILGISALISPLPFPDQNLPDIGMLLFASLLLFLFVTLAKGRKISRVQGTIFVVVYIIYIAAVALRG